MLLQSPGAAGLALVVVMVYLQNMKKYCNGMLLHVLCFTMEKVEMRGEVLLN